MPALLIVTLIATALVAACGTSDSVDPSVEKLGRATGPVTPGRAEEPPRQMPTMPQMKGDGTGVIHTGEVLESFDVSRYTYLRIKTAAGAERWAAVPTAKIAVGDRASVVQSVVMHDFHSPSLDRTFPAIVFGTLADEKTTPTDATDRPAPAEAEGQPSPTDAAPDTAAQRDMATPPAPAALPPGHPPITEPGRQ